MPLPLPVHTGSILLYLCMHVGLPKLDAIESFTGPLSTSHGAISTEACSAAPEGLKEPFSGSRRGYYCVH